MANPVRFETIEKRRGLEKGSLERFAAMEGFPLAGVGVAVEEDVVAWLQLHQQPAGSDQQVQDFVDRMVDGEKFEDAGQSVDPALVSPPEKDANGVEWITIRIPVVRTAPAAPGSNPAPSFRISGREYHLRRAWGAMHRGCQHAHSQLRNGNHVDRMSNSLKFLLEQVAVACGF